MSSETIEFDNKCAFAVMVGGAAKAPEAKPAHSVSRDGKTFGFSGAVPKALFQVIPGSANRAQRAWAKAQA